jgi:hypothetical protein
MSQELLIETETSITFELYREYYLFSMFRGRFYKQQPIIMYAVGAFSTIASLLLGFFFGFDFVTITIPILMIVLLSVMTFLMLYIPKKYYKTAAKLLGGSNKYKFTEEYFYAESNSEVNRGVSQIKYEALHKVYETEAMLYIFISNAQAFIVEKKNLKTEDIKVIRGILKSKLGKMYINYSKE